MDRALYVGSRALARRVTPLGRGTLVDFPAAARDFLEADPDDIVYYMVSSPPGQLLLGNHRLPPPPDGMPADLDHPVYHDALVISGNIHTPVRICSLAMEWSEGDTLRTVLVQLAKSRISRDALARRILSETALPLSLLVLAMSALVWAGIRNGLAPLDRLREAVGGRALNHLAPIRLDSAPLEVRDLAAAVNTLLAEVQASVAQQRRFVNDAAHQLRTPLAGLKGQTELALAEARDPALRARLGRVHESAVRSAHLVTQLLSLARVEPESPLAHGGEDFDLAQLAREVTSEWVPRALAAGLDLGMAEAEENAPLVRVRGHAILLGEALANLIDNAIRYAGTGSEITVAVRLEGPTAVLEVSDNGPGIPAELHRSVFDRFVRATHEGSGAGLGLAIVKGIAERHGGEVRLKAAHPQGVQMQMRLPRLPD
jgi:two-component system sensor histidine kinase TctE